MKSTISFVFIVTFLSITATSEDLQYRPALNLKYKFAEKTSFRVFYRKDMDDQLENTLRNTLKLGITYNTFKHLYFSTNIRYEQLKRNNWTDRFRLELEATPTYSWDKYRVSLRNRFEARYTAGGDHHEPKLRHKAVFVFVPFSKQAFFKSYFTSFEAYINLDEGQSRFDQYDWEPVGLVFNLTPKLSMKLNGIFAYQRNRGQKNWRESKIVALTLNYTFN